MLAVPSLDPPPPDIACCSLAMRGFGMRVGEGVIRLPVEKGGMGFR